MIRALVLFALVSAAGAFAPPRSFRPALRPVALRGQAHQACPARRRWRNVQRRDYCARAVVWALENRSFVRRSHLRPSAMPSASRASTRAAGTCTGTAPCTAHVRGMRQQFNKSSSNVKCERTPNLASGKNRAATATKLRPRVRAERVEEPSRPAWCREWCQPTAVWSPSPTRVGRCRLLATRWPARRTSSVLGRLRSQLVSRATRRWPVGHRSRRCTVCPSCVRGSSGTAGAIVTLASAIRPSGPSGSDRAKLSRSSSVHSE